MIMRLAFVRMAGCPLLMLVLLFQLSSAFDRNFDMETSQVCTSIQPVTLSQFDVANIYARPVLTGPPTRDRCTIKFIGEGGRRFKFTMVKLIYGECQVFVKVYDGDTKNLNQERFSFGCSDSAGGLYYTHNNEIAVSLEKPDPASKRYEFFLKLATEDGPEIGGEPGGENTPEGDSLGPGTIVGIVIVSFIVVVIVVALIVYCVVVCRRKSEERYRDQSLSTLYHTNSKSGTSHGEGSIHSSKHNTEVSSAKENPVFRYPAYRSAGSIMDKGPTCQSLDSKSQDDLEKPDGHTMENIDERGRNTKSKTRNSTVRSGRTKSSSEELEGMRRALEKQEEKKARQEMMDRRREAEKREMSRHQEQSRRHYSTGGRGGSMGRQSRSDRDRPALTADNIRRSLRGEREHSRSHDYDDRDKRRSSSHHGSMRSSRVHGSHTRTHSPSRSGTSSRNPHYDSDYDYRGRRDVKQSNVHRSSSTNSRNRHKRDRYDERDNYHADYDDRDRNRSHKSRHKSDRYYDDYDRGSDSYPSRSGGHRSRSPITGRRLR